MAITNTGSFPKALSTSMAIMFGQDYPQYPTEYSKIFETKKMKRAYAELVAQSGLGLASVKDEGGNGSYDDIRQFFVHRLYQRTYSQGFAVTMEMMEYNQYPELALNKTTRLIKSMKHTLEVLGALVLDRSTSSSYLGGDAKALLATDHPLGKGGTYSNRLAVDADLSESSLEDVINLICDLTDDAGLIIGAKPRKLVVPTELQHDANRLLKTIGRPGTADNDINNVSLFIDRDPVVIHRLTDADAFYVTTDIEDGLCMIESISPKFLSSNEFDSQNNKFLAIMAVVFGWGDARCIAGSPGA